MFNREIAFRWNAHAAILGVVVLVYLVVYAGVVIPLLVKFHVIMSFMSISLLIFPVLLLILITIALTKMPWIKLTSFHVWQTVIIGIMILGFSLYEIGSNHSQQFFDYDRWV
ncbi:hypothetical protein JCM10914A_01930 [Paenibacillus sp. JCM 10914]|uniref:hypothetical protein n=1 Tax=Paenibacillus sp. JCM 10914 TaxID=1236974 RepID=UPI0003CC274D|nr:hypothetical protein [Paenibacillus sp. JCM 10914]GAE06876.1 hypothetical protein JCM10914_3063 [Paenibacillus sp. JCM 10914]